MKITVCGSMAFSKEMVEVKHELESQGHSVVIPDGAEAYISDPYLQEKAAGWGTIEGAQRKIEQDLIKKHYREIVDSDAILILNFDKNGIKHYIGGNSFLEMGFAYVLDKTIYTFNSLPEKQSVFYQELVAMQPIILLSDLTKIKAIHGK